MAAPPFDVDRHERERLWRAEFNSIPATSSFWNVVIADPQRDTMFARAVYRRGAMTLQALRDKLGTDAFFQVLKTGVVPLSGDWNGFGSGPAIQHAVLQPTCVPLSSPTGLTECRLVPWAGHGMGRRAEPGHPRCHLVGGEWGAGGSGYRWA